MVIARYLLDKASLEAGHRAAWLAAKPFEGDPPVFGAQQPFQTQQLYGQASQYALVP